MEPVNLSTTAVRSVFVLRILLVATAKLLYRVSNLKGSILNALMSRVEYKYCSICVSDVIELFDISYINNSLHLARKYARIFVCEHYLVPRSEKFSESEARGKL